MNFGNHCIAIFFIIYLAHIPAVHGRRKANHKNNRQKHKPAKTEAHSDEPFTGAPSITPEAQGITCRNEICNPATQYCDPYDSFCRKCESLCVQGTYGMARRYGQPSRCETLCPAYYQRVKYLTTQQTTQSSIMPTHRPSHKKSDYPGQTGEALHHNQEDNDTESNSHLEITLIIVLIVVGVLIIILIGLGGVLIRLLLKSKYGHNKRRRNTASDLESLDQYESVPLRTLSPKNATERRRSDSGVSHGSEQSTQARDSRDSQQYENNPDVHVGSVNANDISQPTDSNANAT